MRYGSVKFTYPITRTKEYPPLQERVKLSPIEKKIESDLGKEAGGRELCTQGKPRPRSA